MLVCSNLCGMQWLMLVCSNLEDVRSTRGGEEIESRAETASFKEQLQGLLIRRIRRHELTQKYKRRRLYQMVNLGTLHYGFCPLEKFTFKDLAKLTAFATIFKTKSYFRWDIWGSLFIQFHFLSHIRFPPHIFLSFNYFR